MVLLDWIVFTESLKVQTKLHQLNITSSVVMHLADMKKMKMNLNIDIDIDRYFLYLSSSLALCIRFILFLFSNLIFINLYVKMTLFLAACVNLVHLTSTE